MRLFCFESSSWITMAICKHETRRTIIHKFSKGNYYYIICMFSPKDKHSSLITFRLLIILYEHYASFQFCCILFLFNVSIRTHIAETGVWGFHNFVHLADLDKYFKLQSMYNNIEIK